MRKKQNKPSALLNIACGLTAVLMALLLEYKPVFLFQPSFRDVRVPVVNISLRDAIIFYLAGFMFLGGLVTLGITMTNLSIKVRAAALCYFGGWAFGWCWHLIRWWWHWGRR